MAYEVAPFGVHITLVQPGNIATDFTASRVVAAGAAGDSAYAAAMHKAVSLMERDEANGAPAEQVAAAVQRVLSAGRPPRRISVGKAGERAGLWRRGCCPSACSRPRPREASASADDPVPVLICRNGHLAWSPAQLPEPLVGDAEVVADLVDDSAPDLLDDLGLAIADGADSPLVDRDPVGQDACVV